jgi:hypothetical protein
VTELEKLGVQLDALETALEVAARQPAGPQRRRMLQSVQRAAGVARREHRECCAARPDLRVIHGGKQGASDSDDASRKYRREISAAAAITATVVITVSVAFSVMHETHTDALPAPRPPATRESAPHATARPRASERPATRPHGPAAARQPTPAPTSALPDVLRPGAPIAQDVDAQMLAAQPPSALSTPVASSAPSGAPSSAPPSAPTTTSTATSPTTSPASSPACLRLHVLVSTASVCPRKTAGQSHAAG